MNHSFAFRAGAGAILALAATAALAAEPAEGTLTDTSGPLSYTAGPFLLPNPTPQLGAAGAPPVCEPATMTCDVYSLTVTLPDGYADANPDDSIVIETSWAVLPEQDTTGVADFDVYLHDEDGDEVANAATAANPERIRLPVFGGTRKFEIRTITYAPAGQSFETTIRLEKFEAQSSSTGLVGAGSTGAATLLALALAGLARRVRGRR